MKAHSLSAEEATQEMVNTLYTEPELVGPDIAYAITLSQFLENPVCVHLQAVQRI